MEANLFIGTANNINITEIILTTDLFKSHCAFIDRQKELQKAAQLVKIRYTLKQEDYKRLNRKGVLKVYNKSEPVEIPVTTLLGIWKSTHVGVTIFKLDEEWQIEGEQFERKANGQNLFTAIVKKLITKYRPLYGLQKI